MPRITNIQARKGTATDWSTQNPVLASGELGYDLTNKILKLGDGSSNWTSLSSINLSSSNITDFNSSVSGLLPVKNIVAGSNITVTSSSGTYTINSSGGSGGGGLAASSYVSQGKLNSNQLVTSGGDAVIQFVDDYDPQSWFDTTTRLFQPNVAGYYLISVGAWMDDADTTNGQANVQIRLNNNTTLLIQNQLNDISGLSLTGSKAVYMNGTTDYVDFTFYHSAGSSKNLLSAANGTWFTAVLLAYSGQPTVTNYGSNRVLISDNTTTGMSAQSNLTFDGSTLAAPSGSFSSSLKVNNIDVSLIRSYTGVSNFPASGVSNTYYLASDSSRFYQWTGSYYAEIGPPISSVNNAQNAANLYLWSNFK